MLEQKLSRRKEFSYNGFLERVIDEAESGRFPIRRRGRDCERVALIVATLNTLHKKGRVSELRDYISMLVRALMNCE